MDHKPATKAETLEALRYVDATGDLPSVMDIDAPLKSNLVLNGLVEPSGDGYTLTRSGRLALEEGPMRRARVEIDAQTHDEVFEALVSDDDWNGWLIPYFRLAVVRRIATWCERVSDGYCYILVDSDNETVIVAETDGAGREDTTGEGISVQRLSPIDGRYCIGGYAWTWSELDPNAPTEPLALDGWLSDRRAKSKVWCEAANALNAERIKNGEPYDADFRRRQHEAGDAAVREMT